MSNFRSALKRLQRLDAAMAAIPRSACSVCSHPKYRVLSCPSGDGPPYYTSDEQELVPERCPECGGNIVEADIGFRLIVTEAKPPPGWRPEGSAEITEEPAPDADPAHNAPSYDGAFDDLSDDVLSKE